uniref:Uncharacterized protein n=1 Tax=Setaria italica TaxID=4555 RepID=K3ZKW4_SETIT
MPNQTVGLANTWFSIRRESKLYIVQNDGYFFTRFMENISLSTSRLIIYKTEKELIIFWQQ